MPGARLRAQAYSLHRAVKTWWPASPSQIVINAGPLPINLRAQAHSRRKRGALTPPFLPERRAPAPPFPGPIAVGGTWACCALFVQVAPPAPCETSSPPGIGSHRGRGPVAWRVARWSCRKASSSLDTDAIAPSRAPASVVTTTLPPTRASSTVRRDGDLPPRPRPVPESADGHSRFIEAQSGAFPPRLPAAVPRRSRLRAAPPYSLHRR